MTIELDHLIVPSRKKHESARFLADILGVPWGESFAGLVAVYVSDSLTIDFGDRSELDVNHYCFRVSDDEFDTLLARIKERGVPYRSSPHGEVDYKVNTTGGGKNLYWFDPDGHNWEILTVSYARQASPSPK